MLLRLFVNPFIVVLSIVTAFVFATGIGAIHCTITGECSAGVPSVGFTPYIGFILGYILFLSISLVGLGNNGKYWWFVLFVGPVLLWPIYEWNSSVILEFATVLIIGISIGFFIRKTLQKLAPGFMSKIS